MQMTNAKTHLTKNASTKVIIKDTWKFMLHGKLGHLGFTICCHNVI